MPELPEMEIYKALLTQKIGGGTITGVVINREKSTNVAPGDFKTSNPIWRLYRTAFVYR